MAYTVKYTPDVRLKFNGLPDELKKGVNAALDLLVQDPFTPFSAKYGDDERIRVIDATPYVRLRYVVFEDTINVFVFDLTDFSQPLLGS